MNNTKLNNHAMAIQELYELLRLKDWSDYYPEKNRVQALDMWIEKWVVPVSYTQPVVDTKYLTSEFSDVIKTRITQNIVEDVVEDCVTFETLS